MTDKTYKKYTLVIDQWFINGFNGVQAYKKIYPKYNNADKSFRIIHEIPRIKRYIKEKHDQAKKN